MLSIKLIFLNFLHQPKTLSKNVNITKRMLILMVDWRFRFKRFLRAWSRMWHLHDLYAYVLMAVWVGIFFLTMSIIGLVIISMEFSMEISNASFFLAMIPSFFIAWIVTIKVSDYFDMHGW